ncbi:lantibiotic dehydratase [Nonomuraea sp. GTA35]|uniref:lantibiotic dehydratase n=1 Tax=Nonomuraea sp. GTA35 TaxID=1676746 RepID=UPI0035C2675C
MAHPDSGQAERTSLYTASELFMLRAPVLPADTFADLSRSAPVPPPDASAAGRAALAEARDQGRRTLRELAASPRVGQALQVASPDLAAAVSAPSAIEGGGKTANRRHAALLRYLTRMSTRPTPMGLFAGVATGTFPSATGTGEIATLAADPVRATRTRADNVWLARVIDRLGRDRAVRDRLGVRVNALLHRFGTRIVLYRLDEPDRTGHRRIELAVGRPLAVALELAEHVRTFGELAAVLARRFPATPPEKIGRLLDQLWDLGILLPDLLPAPTEPLPEVHLVKRLIDQGVHNDVVDGLTRMRQLADEVDRRAGRTGPADVARLEACQRAMTPGFTGPTFQLDTALALEPATLPAEIGAAAAEAAELLIRLGCAWQRRPHIVDYHHVFLEHYGADVELPLLDVLNPETGLGPPGRYHRPVLGRLWPRQPEPRHPERDRALVETAVRASRDGLLEVELGDELLDRLTVWRPDDAHSRPRTSQDVFFELAAGSPEAIRDGRWRLVLNTIGNYGGWQAFGRFFDLFDEAAVARIRAQQRLEETLRPDTVFAELTYGIRNDRSGNLAGHHPTRDYEVCVNAEPTGPPVWRIPLADIVLGATGNHFYLRSVSLGRPLSVSQTHAVNVAQAPNVCRALLEFSEDGYTPACMFDWGAAAGAPFLPRLTRGNVVVHPAQWTVTAATFPAVEDPDDFFHACHRWRRRWQVPRHVYLTHRDNRLLLDLDHPLWVDELHRQVTRPGEPGEPIRLLEAIPGPGDLWLRDRAGRPYHAELVVPLVLRDRTRMPEPSVPRAAAPPAVTRRWLPGDEWVHLKLYAAPDQHDGIIAGPLRMLLAELDRLTDRWFFIRYADPLPHLRLRFHTSAPDLAAEVMSRCAAWARGLVRDGQATDLAFCSYDREVERYGGGHAIDTVETAFWAGSEVAADLVRLLHTGRGRLDPDVVQVAALHELYEAWGAGPHPHDGAAHVTDAARKRFRELRPLLCEVLTPGERRPDPRAAEYQAVLRPVFARQRQPLADASRRIRELASLRLLTGTERNVVESLAHMQSIRLAGIDRDRERLCRALWSLSRRAIRNRPAADLTGAAAERRR